MLVRRAFTVHCSGLGLVTMLVNCGLAASYSSQLASLRLGFAQPRSQVAPRNLRLRPQFTPHSYEASSSRIYGVT